jgi:hypothetical protein
LIEAGIHPLGDQADEDTTAGQGGEPREERPEAFQRSETLRDAAVPQIVPQALH